MPIPTFREITVLFKAAQKGHSDIVSILLQANAIPTFRAMMVSHLFSWQPRRGTLTLLILLQANANPNLQNDDGVTPLSGSPGAL